MQIYVVIGVWSGVLQDTFAFHFSEDADRKQLELEREYGIEGEDPAETEHNVWQRVVEVQ
jgi:hypothetical protein